MHGSVGEASNHITACANIELVSMHIATKIEEII